MSYLTYAELQDIGFKSLGENVLISNKCSIYNAHHISIGNSVRIDDFCVLSAGDGGILIGNNVHIAVYSLLIGKETIVLKDFSGVSSRVSIYSSSDDYSGNFMTNPTVPKKFTNVKNAPVILEEHVIVGSGSVILPGVTLQQGVAISALSLVNKSCEPYSIYLGVPAKKIMNRAKGFLKLEEEYKSELGKQNGID